MNQWGHGDVFSKIDPEETEKLPLQHERIEIGNPRTQFGAIMQGMWKVIAFCASALFLLFILAALAGSLIGIVSGIAGAL